MIRRQGSGWKLYILSPGEYFQDGYVQDGFVDGSMASVLFSFLTEVEEEVELNSESEEEILFNSEVDTAKDYTVVINR